MDINSLKERILELFLIENIENYKEYSIGDLLIRYKEPIIVEDDKEYKRVTVKNKNRGICLRDIEKGSKIKTKRQFLIKEGLLLLCKINARHGAFGLTYNELNNAIITQNFLAYDVRKELLNIEWFNLLVSARYFSFICDKSSFGSTQRYLNEKEFLNFKINLPSLEDQEIAVSKIEELFALIDILSDGKSSTLINIKNARDKILSLAIKGKLVEQDINDTPAGELLLNILEEKEKLIKEKKLKREKPLPPISEEEKVFDLPVGWEWVRLNNIYNFIDYRGKTPNKIKEGIPLITAKNVRKGYISYIEADFITEKEFEERKSRGISRKGDILFTTEAPLGNVALADLSKFSTGQRLITFQQYSYNQLLVNKLFMFFIMSNYFQRILIDKKTGTTVYGIKSAKLKNLPIPLPPLQEQHRIVAKIEELFSLLDIIENELT